MNRFALHELLVRVRLEPPSEPDDSKQECRKWNRVFAKDRKRRRKQGNK